MGYRSGMRESVEMGITPRLHLRIQLRGSLLAIATVHGLLRFADMAP